MNHACEIRGCWCSWTFAPEFWLCKFDNILRILDMHLNTDQLMECSLTDARQRWQKAHIHYSFPFSIKMYGLKYFRRYFKGLRLIGFIDFGLFAFFLWWFPLYVYLYIRNIYLYQNEIQPLKLSCSGLHSFSVSKFYMLQIK